MAFLDSYRINKAIATLLAAPDETSPEAVQAVSTLKRLGQGAIPKLIEALGKAHQPRVLIAVLKTCVQNATLPLFGDGLASANTRVVAGVVELLAQSQAYDPSHLLDFWDDPRIPKATLGKLLGTHQEKLDANRVLRCLDSARPEERPMLLGLLSKVATVDLVPALIRRLTSKDETVRLAMARTLVRFGTEDVHGALIGLLTDPHAPVRQAALDGLGRLELPLDLTLICPLLRDEERAVRRQAMTLLAQRKDPRTVAYLFDLLQDAPADIRQGALELLQVVGNVDAIKEVVATSKEPMRVCDVLLQLLTDSHARVRNLALVGVANLRVPFDVEPICQLLSDTDATVRRQAAAILTRQNDPRIFPFLLATLQDDSPDVQLNAVAILNALGNAALLKTLLGNLQGKEWWVSARVTDALGKHGSAKVIAATLQLVTDEDAFLRRIAVEILKLTQDDQVLPFLVDALQHDTPWVKTCAADALAALGDKRAVPALLHIVETGEPAEQVIALRTLTALGDAHALPVCLAQVQHGTAAVQQEALRAIATLTNTEHAEAVLQAVMAVRATATDLTLKGLVNSTATTLIRRFGVQAVGHSQAIDTGMSRIASPSLLQEATADHLPQTEVMNDAESVLPTPIGRGTESRLDTTALEPGMMLGERYRVIRLIGQGGFGTVLLVEDTMVHEELVLKFLYLHLAADERMIARFIHELRYARRVTHENVIRIHDFLKIDRAFAISMEYFPSQNLSVELASQVPLALPRGLWIVWQVCRGMHPAHQAQIIHRDLKPPNILINDAGLVKIVDFGLAAVANDTATRLTRTGMLLGTPLYMAPEQVQNHKVDARVDIYSLGVIMYEVFTGTPPYTGENPMAILFQHVAGKAVRPREVNPNIPEALEAIIIQAMAVEPDKRFQSMDALGKQLVPLLKQYVR